MTEFARQQVEELIGEWRAYLTKRRSIDAAQLEELEARLRRYVDAFTGAGLDAGEAFLAGLRRIARLDAASRDFVRFHGARLWRQFATGAERQIEPAVPARSETFVVLGLAGASALAVKTPVLFGIPFGNGNEAFYLRNASLFVFPFLAVYFSWKRGLGTTGWLWLLLCFAAGGVFANLYPFRMGGDTEVLTALHLPIALWFAVGLAYVRGAWFSRSARMDFVRFSGELAVYYALIALGGGVFIAVAMMLFRAIGLDATWLARDWLVPCGAAGAVIIGSWLVELKQGAMENFAPLLTKLFTPLFTVLLLAFLATMAWTGNPVNIRREVLIGFDLLLALVVGLVLYAASARDPEAPPGFFDGLQLALVSSALVVDGVALAAIGSRISGFGFTPNRVAALGENLILLVNLAGSAWLYACFLRRRRPFAGLERWQIAYLPVYFVWAWLVVAVFPPLFSYR